MLMFELLFWVWGGRQACLSHMQQMYLQGIVSAGDWKSTSSPQEYFWSREGRGGEGRREEERRGVTTFVLKESIYLQKSL